MPGIKFGVEPNMREVPPGQSALIKLGDFTKWEVVETEWGSKYSFPITLLEHPSYTSIPKAGLDTKWQSKSVAAQGLYFWIYDKDGAVHEFDFDIDKEIKGNWKLDRTDSGTYLIEKL